jgi:hypothetical protein
LGTAQAGPRLVRRALFSVRAAHGQQVLDDGLAVVQAAQRASDNLTLTQRLT